MSDDPHPAKRAYVTIDGRRWELVPTNKLTFPETKEAKRVSGGMSLVEIEQGVENADPDAWFAWLYVSIRREWPALTVAELERAFADTPLVAVIATVEARAPEVADPNPPAQAPPSGADELPNGNGSGEKTQQPSTPETSGHRT